jgi:hypothetical protein
MDCPKKQADTPYRRKINKKKIFHFGVPKTYDHVKATRRLLPKFFVVSHFDCGHNTPRQYSYTSPAPQGIMERQQHASNNYAYSKPTH